MLKAKDVMTKELICIKKDSSIYETLQLLAQNDITDKDFLPGAEEATAFDDAEYVRLHFSTLRKVQMLATIAQRTDEGSLKTNSTWRDSFGLYPQAIGESLKEHWLAYLIGAAITVVSLIITLIEILSN